MAVGSSGSNGSISFWKSETGRKTRTAGLDAGSSAGMATIAALRSSSRPSLMRPLALNIVQGPIGGSPICCAVCWILASVAASRLTTRKPMASPGTTSSTSSVARAGVVAAIARQTASTIGNTRCRIIWAPPQSGKSFVETTLLCIRPKFSNLGHVHQVFPASLCDGLRPYTSVTRYATSYCASGTRSVPAVRCRTGRGNEGEGYSRPEGLP